MNDHHHWMKIAYSLAEKAQSFDEVPVGAVIVKDNQIIGQGYNQSILNHDPCAHAEIIALRDAGKFENNYRLVNTTLYVTLEPCAMCAMAMVHARIKTVVIATKDPRTGAAGSVHQLLQHKAHNHQLEIVENILKQPCSDLLKSFFKAKRNQKK